MINLLKIKNGKIKGQLGNYNLGIETASNAEIYFKCLKLSICAKIKYAKNEVKKIADKELKERAKNVFGKMKSCYKDKVLRKKVETFCKATQKETKKFVKEIRYESVTGFANLLTKISKFNAWASGFGAYVKNKRYKLAYVCSELKEAINNKLFNINIDLYNRKFYNYSILGSEEDAEAKNKIYKEDISALLLYPKEYADMLENAKKQVDKNGINEAVESSNAKENDVVGGEVEESAGIVKNSASVIAENVSDAESASGVIKTENAGIVQNESTVENGGAGVVNCENDKEVIAREFENALNEGNGQDCYNAGFWNGVKGYNAKQVETYKKALANGVLNKKILVNGVSNKKTLALAKVVLNQKDVTRTC